ncbi:hypothetical protein PR048_002294 [Dryococelus australis]|uniref:Reverse transcriptase/retrotransposon-derived protein RNase H-like domain-containing protein n=1 Tax=Dryococelus australis TaxID=614101 RepID=A0ABQ9IMA1_9NEOP|nr:hypothetical protein PR048_002294 [Dryococelus australis]
MLLRPWGAKSHIPVLTKICINNKLLETEVDTGARFPLCVAGQINVKVQDKNSKMRCLVLLVGSPNLGSSFVPSLGRSWLDALFPYWRQQWCKMIHLVSEREEVVTNCRSQTKSKSEDLYSDWASPVVVVPKNGQLRLCVDFKVTLKKVLNVDHFPLPKIDDVFETLGGGKVFTLLDLRTTYQQLEVPEKYQHSFTINSHLGLFRFKHLPHDVASMPAIFHAIMDQIIGNMPMPLYVLTKKNVPWQWPSSCQKVFAKSKQMPLYHNVLVHFDPKLFLVLSCDARSYGVGVVLSHVIDSEERPVLVASSEQNYSQLEREALAIIFGGIPTLAASWLQQWAIILQAFTYQSQYCKRTSMGPADAMSHLPAPTEVGVDEAKAFTASLDYLPITPRNSQINTKGIGVNK